MKDQTDHGDRHVFNLHVALFRIPDGNIILCNTGDGRDTAHPFEQTYICVLLVGSVTTYV